MSDPLAFSISCLIENANSKQLMCEMEISLGRIRTAANGLYFWAPASTLLLYKYRKGPSPRAQSEDFPSPRCKVQSPHHNTHESSGQKNQSVWMRRNKKAAAPSGMPFLSCWKKIFPDISMVFILYMPVRLCGVGWLNLKLEKMLIVCQSAKCVAPLKRWEFNWLGKCAVQSLKIISNANPKVQCPRCQNFYTVNSLL